jgi:putative oxidoreductase
MLDSHLSAGEFMREKRLGAGLLHRVARAAIASAFIKLGFDAAREPGGRPARVEAFGIPEPELMVRLNGAGMVAAGATLALGIRPRESALALLLLLLPTTVVGHPFWQEREAPARRAQEIQFLKNTTMAGGLLAVIAGEV